jgi:hypothetical protein
VNIRETSELNEFAALIPKTIRIIPPANSAIEMALFIENDSFVFQVFLQSPYSKANYMPKATFIST